VPSWSGVRLPTRACFGTSCAQRRSCTRPTVPPVRRSPSGSMSRPSRTGEDGSATRACGALRRNRGRGGPRPFPPAQVAEVKALACELPSENGVPLSRYSSSELAREAVKRGIVRRDLRHDGLAVARRERDRPLELSLVDLPRDSNLPRRLVGCWISTRAGGKVSCCIPAISWCARTRNRRFRAATAATPRSRGSRRWAEGPSTSTSARARCATSPHGTSAAPRSSIGAHQRTGSSRSTRWSQGPHARRLHRPRCRPALTARVRPTLRTDRPTLQMEVHPARPSQAPRPRQRPPPHPVGSMIRQLNSETDHLARAAHLRSLAIRVPYMRGQQGYSRHTVVTHDADARATEHGRRRAESVRLPRYGQLLWCSRRIASRARFPGKRLSGSRSRLVANGF
jgi:hypothetical protein